MTGKCVPWWLYLIRMFVFVSGRASPSTNRTQEEPSKTLTNPTTLTRLKYLQIYPDANGETHFDTVVVEQCLMAGAPPVAPILLLCG